MTRDQCLRQMRGRLREAAIDSFSLDARLLLLHVLRINDMDLVRAPDAPLSVAEIAAVEDVLMRRIAREPVARILGEQEFYGLPFSLGPDTLIPRPETELLVDEALRRIPDNGAHPILDLGTGTGCILLSILHHRPLCSGLGIDAAAGAVMVAKRNAERIGLSTRASFQSGDWAHGLNGPFDLVLSNPPYIDSDVVPGLAPEVESHDPKLALDGGSDGLNAYRQIIPALPRLLKPSGVALLEIGFDQGARVSELAHSAGLTIEAVRPDLAGHDRMIILAAG